VIGLEFPSVAVRSIAAAGVREAAPVQLASLERKHLVRHEPSSDERNDYRFDHLLIRDAAYAGILKRERAQLHERFAEWLEQSDTAADRDDVIGFHLEQAARYGGELGSVDDHVLALARRASEKLATAGRRAFARGDLPAAVDFLRRAHDVLAADEASRVLIVPELAEALMESGDFVAARQVLGEAAVGGQDASSRCAAARSRLVLLLVDYYSGSEENWAIRAEAEVARAIPLFEASGHQTGLATAWRVRYGAQISANRYDLAAESADRIVQHAEAAGDVLQQRRGATGYALAMLLGSMPVREALERAESLVEGVEGDRRTQSVIMLFIAQLAAMDGQIERARATYRQARDMLEELGRGVLAASTSTDAAPVEVLAGDLDAAERMLRTDDADLEALGENYLRSTVGGLLARVLVMKGEFAEAERVAERTRTLAAADDVDAQVLWRSSLGRSYAAQGRSDEAVALAKEAVALTDDVAAPLLRADALTDLAVVLTAADRVDEARARFAEALAMHEAKGNRLGADELRKVTSSLIGS
jgi:tetratricopeptide (TPR) repeat protein